jgi:hypothetical protein
MRECIAQRNSLTSPNLWKTEETEENLQSLHRRVSTQNIQTPSYFSNFPFCFSVRSVLCPLCSLC